jgi:DNA-binding LytR/AlgR family response regulator
MGFYSEAGYTFLQTWQDKKYITDRSLDKTEVMVPAEFFFRMNRQYLIHRMAVTGFRTAGDGKLEIQVRTAGKIPSAISVSRIRAARFRRWFDSDGG